MSDLTIRDVPDDLRRRLEAQAARNRQSVDREALRALERGLDRERPLLDALADSLTDQGSEPAESPTLARLDALRERQRAEGVWLTQELIDAARHDGRP